jgi:DNA-binding NarL/FixJ family response regulator
MIRISIVEDDATTRKGLVVLLRQSPKIICLATYSTAEQAEREIPENLPDVVLMDINLPGRSGIDCVAKLKRAHPKLQFVMLTTYQNNESIFNSLRAGAGGYLLKDAMATEVIQAIEEVHLGGAPMSMPIARLVISHFYKLNKPASDVETLTEREREILSLLAKGLSYKRIAYNLGISYNTVHNHLRAVYKKLHVQSCTEAVAKLMNH